MSTLIDLKREYFNCLDRQANHIASKLADGKLVTKLLMRHISTIYESAKLEKTFENPSTFETAYHQPITSDLEFLVSRIIVNYSKKNNLDWKIYLRKQKKNCNTNKYVVPDIRIENNGRLLCIIEIKAKGSWMQPFFKKSNNDKDPNIIEAKKQLMKYSNFENCGKENIYLLLPTLTSISKKKGTEDASYHRKAFAENSGLNAKNLILLSNNVFLDLSNPSKDDFDETTDFEEFIKVITKKSLKKDNLRK